MEFWRDSERLKAVVGATAGMAAAHSLDDQAVRALQGILASEAASLTAQAHSIAAAAGAADHRAALAAAVKARRFATAPSRAISLEAARVMNSRPVAWPLGPEVLVPLEQAAAHRADVLLRGPGAAPDAVVDASRQAEAALRAMPTPAHALPLPAPVVQEGGVGPAGIPPVAGAGGVGVGGGGRKGKDGPGLPPGASAPTSAALQALARVFEDLPAAVTSGSRGS